MAIEGVITHLSGRSIGGYFWGRSDIWFNQRAQGGKVIWCRGVQSCLWAWRALRVACPMPCQSKPESLS